MSYTPMQTRFNALSLTRVEATATERSEMPRKAVELGLTPCDDDKVIRETLLQTVRLAALLARRAADAEGQSVEALLDDLYAEAQLNDASFPRSPEEPSA